MLILALDLGSTTTKTAATLLQTESGEVRRTSIPTTPTALVSLLGAERPDRVVLESTIGTAWSVDVCRACGVGEIQVANPMDEAWRNRSSKTDKRDADLLAKLSASGQLRTIHVPERPVRQWRSLIDLRHQTVRARTRVKNRIKFLLRQEGLPTSKLWTKAGLSWLTTESKPLTGCPADQLWRGQLSVLVRRLEETQRDLREIESKLDHLSQHSAAAQTLQELDGIGPRLAEAFVSALDDPLRFKNQKDIGAYLGLVPRVFQSGKRLSHGGITKSGNPTVRWLLIEIVHLAIRHDDESHWIGKIYRQLLRGDATRQRKAIVGTARRVAVILWAKLRDQQRTKPTPTLSLAA
jgi:transposase